ncbi:InlB B-repeat-containing protein [Culicoidibacter larvae]|uniref:LPXTG cell wall anchor domain-containing protein n=1 Tax=Culicoidibacter larvae TaxID=2579976 RepID=A0A5R8Q850_9FIRM|nr:InlB B-repeat-containing protein [Culicoidibacter larvae]TLG71770.1 LPXTG cell wall anchor domain-containing protein [Culicoidibacter larvae]
MGKKIIRTAFLSVIAGLLIFSQFNLAVFATSENNASEANTEITSENNVTENEVSSDEQPPASAEETQAPTAQRNLLGAANVERELTLAVSNANGTSINTANGTTTLMFQAAGIVSGTIKLKSPAKANEYIELVVPSDMNLSGFNKGNLEDIATISLTGKTYRFNLIEGAAAGQYVFSFTTSFNYRNTMHNETRDITMTDYVNSTSTLAEKLNLTMFNDTKLNIVMTSGQISPGAKTLYNLSAFTRSNNATSTNYPTSNDYTLAMDATVTIPLPAEATFVEGLNAGVTYDAGSHSVTVAFTSILNGTTVKGFSVTYNGVNVGDTVTAPSAPTVDGHITGKTAPEYTFTNNDIITPLKTISGTVMIPKTLVDIRSFVNGMGNYMYIGEKGDTRLYGIQFSNNTSYDGSNFKVTTKPADGMLVNGFYVPGSNIYDVWSGSITATVTTNTGRTIQKVIPNATTTVNAAALGLTAGEYLTELEFAFSEFKVGQKIWYSSGSPQEYSYAITMYGTIDETYRDGVTVIKSGDIRNVVTTISDDQLSGTTTMAVPYTDVKTVPLAGGTSIAQGNSFLPGANVNLNVQLDGSWYPYGNDNRVDDPNIYVTLPLEFTPNMDAIIVTPGAKNGSITNIEEVENVAAAADGKKVWKITTSNVYTPGSGMKLSIPVKIDQYAIPGMVDLSQAVLIDSPYSYQKFTTAYGSGVYPDKYDVNENGRTNDSLIAIGVNGRLSNVLILNTGFSAYHRAKSDDHPAWSAFYSESKTESIVNFYNNSNGEIEVIVNNPTDKIIDQYTYYESLPKGANEAVRLTGAITTPSGFEITYTTAATPERNELSGGSDTTYVPAASITDWSKVSGFKVKATSPIPGSTTTTITVPIHMIGARENTTDYDELLTAQSSFIFAEQGGPATIYQGSVLAYQANNVTVSGTVFKDLDQDLSPTKGAGDADFAGLTVNLWNQDKSQKLATTTTDASGAYSFKINAQNYLVEVVNPNAVQWEAVDALAKTADTSAKVDVSDLAIGLVAKQYAVNFIVDGATVSTENVRYNNVVTNPASNPTKGGYTFLSWSQTQGGTAWNFTNDKMPASNLNLYAQFSADNQTITFDVNGGDVATEPADIVQPTDSSVTISAVPSYAGYTFVGWFDSSNVQHSGTFAMPNGGLDLVAHWTAANQVISFDAAGGSGVDSIVEPTGASVDIDSAVTTRAGYQFDGWYNGATQVDGIITMPVGGMQLTAHWTALDQTITFDVNGGLSSSKPDDIIAPTDSIVDIDAVTEPQRPGYRFLGWYNNDELVFGSINMPAGGMTLKAAWKDLIADGVWKINGDHITMTVSEVDGYMANGTLGQEVLAKSNAKAWDDETGEILTPLDIDCSSVVAVVGDYHAPVTYTPGTSSAAAAVSVFGAEDAEENTDVNTLSGTVAVTVIDDPVSKLPVTGQEPLMMAGAGGVLIGLSSVFLVKKKRK